MGATGRRVWAAARAVGGIVADLGRRLGAARVSEASATLAYYALLSIFPLTVLLVAAGSFLLEGERALRLAVDAVSEAFPGTRELIERNVEQVIKLRGPVGLLSVVTLSWSASTFFSLLADNIERAWPDVASRSFVNRRLLALAMVLALAVLMVLSLLARAVLQSLPEILHLNDNGASALAAWATLSRLLPWLIMFVLYTSLYRWIPRAYVEWRAAALGAAAATLLWQTAGRALVWYLGSGLARYELVYGSLGAVIVLMLWVYVTSWVTLAGAHFSALISRRWAGPNPKG